MTTLTVDDRSMVVSMLMNILKRIAPDGDHLGTTDVREALELARAHPLDVAFLDVEMPGMSGIELAKALQDKYPVLNIIFITGYQEYMPEAFAMYASGYLLKPVREKDVRGALAHLRYRQSEITAKPLTVSCFGNFEVMKDSVPVKFPRSKCKELFAYLVDRRGAVCTNDMLMGILWPDRLPTESLKSMLRTLLADVRHTLEEIDAADVFIRDRGGYAIDPSRLDCDYYRYLEGDALALHQFHGEYMMQYSFAEDTRAQLLLF